MRVINWQGHRIFKSSLFDPVTPYYVTVFTREVRSLFSDQASCEMMVNILTYNRYALDYRVLGFVIMPDHIHIIFLPQKVPIDQVIMKNTANFTRYYHQLIPEKTSVWEHDYYQLPVEDVEMLYTIRKHIHSNPCRNKLVNEERSYYYSSYRFYEENDPQSFPLLLDRIE